MSTGGFRPLNLVRPFLSILPDVAQADRRVPFKEKAIYTAVSLFIFKPMLAQILSTGFV